MDEERERAKEAVRFTVDWTTVYEAAMSLRAALDMMTTATKELNDCAGGTMLALRSQIVAAAIVELIGQLTSLYELDEGTKSKSSEVLDSLITEIDEKLGRKPS